MQVVALQSFHYSGDGSVPSFAKAGDVIELPDSQAENFALNGRIRMLSAPTSPSPGAAPEIASEPRADAPPAKRTEKRAAPRRK